MINADRVTRRVVDAQGAPLQTRPRDYPGAELLATHRLRLRGLRFADMGELSVLHDHESVRSLLLEPVPVSFLEVAGLVIQANHAYEQHPGLGIWRAADHGDRFIGLFSLMPIDADPARVELGARLMPTSGGRLYSLEGARALRDHAFATLQLDRLHGFCHPQNHAVPAIFRRLGFTGVEDTVHFGKPALRFVLERDAWSAKRHEVADDETRKTAHERTS